MFGSNILAFNFNGFNGSETYMVGGIFAFFLLVILVNTIIKIFYLITLSRALSYCSPESRKMSPGLVWIEIIPFIGFIWAFVNFINVSGSIGNEFRRRGISSEENPGMLIGIVSAVLTLCAGVIQFAGLAALVCWIIYWVKIAGYTNTLKSHYLAG